MMKPSRCILLSAAILLSMNTGVLADEESKVLLEGQITRANTVLQTSPSILNAPVAPVDAQSLLNESKLSETTNISDGINTFDVLDQVPKKQIVKSSVAKKVVSKIVSVGNFVLDLRGFDWSIEGADVALEEKTTYKSVMAKEFVVRRANDRRELDTVAAIFQTGMVSGLEDPEKRDKLLEANNIKLVKLLGEGNAKQVKDRFSQLHSDSVKEIAKEAATWTVDEQQEKFKQIVEATIENDPEVKSLLTRMHKFNGHSKFARVTAKIVYTTLGIAAFSPTFVAPAAEASLLAFMTATGGPEQDKLLREMYLYKCLESRYKTIHEEAHLAVANAQIAALTGNKPLTACSLDLINRMAGKQTVANVFPSMASKQVAAKTTVQTKVDLPLDNTAEQSYSPSYSR